MSNSSNPFAKRVYGAIDFGTAVKIMRIARGITSKELSNKSGINESRISRIENGGVSSNPTLSTLRALANGLDTDTRTLVSIQEDIVNLLDRKI